MSRLASPRFIYFGSSAPLVTSTHDSIYHWERFALAALRRSHFGLLRFLAAAGAGVDFCAPDGYESRYGLRLIGFDPLGVSQELVLRIAYVYSSLAEFSGIGSGVVCLSSRVSAVGIEVQREVSSSSKNLQRPCLSSRVSSGIVILCSVRVAWLAGPFAERRAAVAQHGG